MICELKTNLVGMVRAPVHLIGQGVVQTVAWERKLLVWNDSRCEHTSE
jgi:hypothetical protein